MRFLGLLILDHKTSTDEGNRLAQLGFRKRIATDDKSFAFQLPYPGWAIDRDGDSAEQVRDEILGILSENELSAFLIVAERFSCGRT
ncbi:MAG: hypothetical protein ACJ8C4_19420 [Gemmataceae bacterium]